jgi:hypothetical protein
VDAKSVELADLPPTTVALLELVARGFDLTSGPAVVELTFQDGGFQFAWLRRRVRLSDLREFDAVFAEAWRIERALTSG